MLKRLKQAWKRDRLGVLGIGSAIVAFALWALPVKFECWTTYDADPGFVYRSACSAWASEEAHWLSDGSHLSEYFDPDWWFDNYLGYVGWFTTERLAAVGFLFALAVILLLLRRR